ncbi:MAG: membrane protein insertase YidC [Nevskiaceae bacterium]|nr:MAG: membrane protein insertase YidC [Nevskiaceae bacterium]TBR72494.1 MAG: membrane protein insertase YidC [Nevskiaceae bacterium]
MESRRFALIALLGVVLFFAYQAWEKDYGPQSAGAQQSAGTAATPMEVPAPQAQALAEGASKAGGAATAAAGTEAAVPPAGTALVHVQTDVMDATIALDGASLQRLVLENYAYSKEEPGRKLALLNSTAASNEQPFFVFQTGIAGVEQPLSGDRTPFTAPKSDYRLAAGQQSLDVPLTYVDAERGYTVRIVYHFERGSYVVKLRREIRNAGSSPLQAAPYARWLRNTVQAGVPQKFVHTYFGSGIYQQDGDSYKFKKYDLEDFAKKPLTVEQQAGWAAMLQQYFLAAVVPPPGAKVTYTGRSVGNNRYYLQAVGATTAVAPGATQAFNTTLYIGPKLQGKLDAVAPGLALTEDYGIFTPIAKPLFWVLTVLKQLTGNWGWAIVLLTLAIRGAFFKLSEKQYRSMAKMRKFGPRIKELRERYAGDREQLNRAMMDLYKKEKFNPLSGCWPLLLQFPVFIALYYVLIESVEMRQAPFVLWLQDLSSPDPYYLLPIVYGITMWFQQRLSGQMATMEPAQQKIMNVMPIGLAAFFSLFPSGLVLYYVVSNAFTIIQQYVITRRLDREGLGKH